MIYHRKMLDALSCKTSYKYDVLKSILLVPEYSTALLLVTNEFSDESVYQIIRDETIKMMGGNGCKYIGLMKEVSKAHTGEAYAWLDISFEQCHIIPKSVLYNLIRIPEIYRELKLSAGKLDDYSVRSSVSNAYNHAVIDNRDKIKKMLDRIDNHLNESDE